MKKICHLILLLLVLSSCGGVADSEIELGDNYFYKGEGKQYKLIFHRSKTGDEVIIPPEIKSFVFDKDFIAIKQLPSRKLYRLLLSEDLSYITTAFHFATTLSHDSLPKAYKQAYANHISDSAFYYKLNQNLSQQNTTADREYLNQIADSMLLSALEYKDLFSGELKYWIIQKKTKEVIGPLNKDDFEKTSKRLALSNDLLHNIIN